MACVKICSLHTSRPTKHNGENFRQYISTVLRLLLLSILRTYAVMQEDSGREGMWRGVLYIKLLIGISVGGKYCPCL